MKSMLTQKTLRLPNWLWGTLFLFLAGGGIAYLTNQPHHASWRYGACRVFLEQFVRFPQSIAIKQGGETRGSAIISFSDINTFGSQQVRVFECYFSNDAQGRMTLSRITLDRKAIPEGVLKTFARQLPVLAGQKLDTALPKDIPNNLEDLKD